MALDQGLHQVRSNERLVGEQEDHRLGTGFHLLEADVDRAALTFSPGGVLNNVDRFPNEGSSHPVCNLSQNNHDWGEPTFASGSHSVPHERAPAPLDQRPEQRPGT